MRIFIALRTALANLYPTQADARRIVADAEMNPLHIEFSDKAINTWHSILKEAENSGAIMALLQIAINEYSANSALKSAVEAYYSANLQSSSTTENFLSSFHWIKLDSGRSITGNANTRSEFAARDSENDAINLMLQKLWRTENLLIGPLIEWLERPNEPKYTAIWDVFDQFKLIIRYGRLHYQCQKTDKRQAAYDMAIYQLRVISEARDKLPPAQWFMLEILIERIHKELSPWHKREMVNPFIFLEPLRGRPPFVGRNSELRALKRAGSRGTLQPVLLSGLVYSGKNSLVQKAMFEYKDDIVFVTFSIPDSTDGVIAPKQVLWAMYHNLLRRLNQQPLAQTLFDPNPEAITEEAVRHFCARYGKKATLVFAVDHIDRLSPVAPQPILHGMKVTNSAVIGAMALFAFWAKLVAIANLSFIFISCSTELPDTPFTPLLKKIRLKNLEAKEVHKLLTTPTPEFIPLFAPATIEYIFELTAGQPYLVQLIGHYVIDQFNEELDKENKPEPVFMPADVDTILASESFHQFSQFYFQTLRDQLERLHSGSNSVLRAVAQYADGMNAADLEQNLAGEHQWSGIEAILTFLEMEQVIQVEEGRFRVVGELLRQTVAGK